MPLLAAGCEAGNRLVREVHETCAKAPDVAKCEDAEYNRRADEERAKFNRGRVYP